MKLLITRWDHTAHHEALDHTVEGAASIAKALLTGAQGPAVATKQA